MEGFDIYSALNKISWCENNLQNNVNNLKTTGEKSVHLQPGGGQGSDISSLTCMFCIQMNGFLQSCVMGG